MTKPASRTRRFGGRGARAGGGDYWDWRAERGDDGRDATEMVFFLCIVRARMHEFAAKKTQGKNRAMQRHEQVLPPSPPPKAHFVVFWREKKTSTFSPATHISTLSHDKHLEQFIQSDGRRCDRCNSFASGSGISHF